MNAQAETKPVTVSSIQEDPFPREFRELAARLQAGTISGWEASCKVLHFLGAYEYQEREICRLRQDVLEAYDYRYDRHPAQATPAQQQQAQAMDPGIEIWANEFDQFLATPEGEAWLEQQAENMADPYFV